MPDKNLDQVTVKPEDWEKFKNDTLLFYFGNGGTEIRRVSDSILRSINYHPNGSKELDEFYSLAGELFEKILNDWDRKHKFESFLYVCLSYRFKSFLTEMTAQKRGGGQIDRSLFEEVGDGLVLQDTIGGEMDFDILSPEMTDYIGKLSPTQRKIFLKIYEGFLPFEIQRDLDISPKAYQSLMKDAKQYKKIKALINVTSKKTESKTNKEGNGFMQTTETSKSATKTAARMAEDLNDETIRDDNQIQREFVWTNVMMGNLVATMLLGYLIPPVVIAEQKLENGSIRWLLDGKQRLTTISMYLANAFRISKKVEHPFVTYQTIKTDENGKKIYDNNNLPVFEEKTFDIRNKRFNDLPRELQKRIEDYGIRYDLYLGCTASEIESHIRRYNTSRSMNHSQRGLTFLGLDFGLTLRGIQRKSFFSNTYKEKDFQNGAVQRIIMESIMLINYQEDWKSSPEKIGEYLSQNADGGDFVEFAEYVDRIDDVLDDETRAMFTTRDSFLWFKVFSDFTEMGYDDEKFNDFLKAFDSLKDTEIDGETFESLNSKSTKMASAIEKKINYIEELIQQYLSSQSVEKAS